MDAQGSQTNAKEDTVFLALSGALTTDLSQYDTDLTSISTGAFETNSARTALDEEWEVYVRCSLSPGDKDKVLVAVHSADLSTITFALRTTSTGLFAAMMGSPPGDIWTGPALPTGDCSFSWSMRVNPDSTGAGDARISTFVVYDHTAGAYLAIAQVTHAAPTAAATHTLSVGGAYFAAGPSLVNAPANAPTKVRISSSFHPHVEFAEDWVAARSAHSTDLDELVEPFGAGMTAVGAVAEWAGQANVAFAAAHARALRGRMLSPMINERYPQARTLTIAPDPTQWIMGAPSSAAYLMDCTLLRWLPCDGWRWAYVWVQVQSWVLVGAAVPIGIRVYATNRPHIGLGVQLEGQPMPPLQVEYAEATLTADHTSSGEGEWLELGPLRLPAMVEHIDGWVGGVTLGVAYAFDPAGASANDSAARLKIKAMKVLPFVGEP